MATKNPGNENLYSIYVLNQSAQGDKINVAFRFHVAFRRPGSELVGHSYRMMGKLSQGLDPICRDFGRYTHFEPKRL